MHVPRIPAGSGVAPTAESGKLQSGTWISRLRDLQRSGFRTCFSIGGSGWWGGEVTHPDKLLEIASLGGSGYHFLDRYADRIVTLKRSMP
jgi:hypothetical protein